MAIGSPQVASAPPAEPQPAPQPPTQPVPDGHQGAADEEQRKKEEEEEEEKHRRRRRRMIIGVASLGIGFLYYCLRNRRTQPDGHND